MSLAYSATVPIAVPLKSFAKSSAVGYSTIDPSPSTV